MTSIMANTMRDEATRRCADILENLDWLSSQLRRAREQTEETAAVLRRGESAGNCPIPSCVDLGLRAAGLGRQCARLETLVMLAFEAEGH